MTTEEIKSEAEKIREMFSIKVTILGCGQNEGNPCVVSDTLSHRDARILSIIHVKGIMKALKNAIPDLYDLVETGVGVSGVIVEPEDYNNWKSILTELEIQ